MSMKQQTGFLTLALGICAAGVTQSEALAAEPEALRALPLNTPFTAEAAQKLDPRLIFAEAFPRRTVGGLLPLTSRVSALGSNIDVMRYPVMIESSLSDRELAGLGAQVNTRVGDIVTAFVAARDLGLLANDPDVRYVEAAYPLQPTLDVSIPEINADDVNSGSPPLATGAGVIYGILDSGVDPTHADFKLANGQSRLLFAWDQFGQGSPPAGFAYGREYTQAQLSQANPGFGDDDGHGTHVCGTSVGDGSSLPSQKYRGVAPAADIIAVINGGCDMFCYGGGVPPWEPTSSVGSIDGLNYLLQKKQQLGKPLVVNQSQGVMMGPHDGTTLFERTYDQLVTQNNLIICIAAGNDEESGWHGRKTVSQGSQVSFTLNHVNGQNTQGTLGWEGWTKTGDRCRWQIVTPGGQTIELPANLGGNQIPGQVTSHADSVFTWSIASHPANQQGYASVFVLNRTNGAQTGNWQFRAIAESVTAGGQVDVYCERNQFGLSVTDGRNNDALIGMPGTTTNAITVASYATKDHWESVVGPIGLNPPPTLGQISSFSSFGPRRDGAQKPDIAAPGEWIIATLSEQARQHINNQQIEVGNKHWALQGTSMATPHVSGVVALMLEKAPNLTAAQVKQALQTTARHDAFTGQGWNQRFGHGKVDALAAVQAVSGGGGGCSTRDGDANQDNLVNILDVVATVNDILGTTPLGAGRECVDLNNDSVINILDVVAVVNIILGGRPASDAPPATLAPVAWGESLSETEYVMTLDAKDLAGVQASFVLPRGYEPAGQPYLRGAAGSAAISARQTFQTYTVVAWNPTGELGASSDRVSLVLPIERAWDSGQSASDLALARMQISDRYGRERTLAENPTLGGEATTAPLGAWLGRANPNPVSGTTQIEYSLSTAGPIAVDIYDASGRRVRELFRGSQTLGGHMLPWDGRDDRGQEVPDGTYFLRLASDSGTSSQKVVVLKR